jgi:hypothetical protein
MNKLIPIMIALFMIAVISTVNILDIQQANAGAPMLRLIDTCPSGHHWNPDLQTCDES